MTDDAAVIEASNRMGWCVDQRDWDGAVALFTDTVDVDYTSLNGGEPTVVTPDDLVNGWRGILENLDGTQHLLAGHLVTIDGDTATCTCNVQATHVRANNTGAPHWVVGGRYDFTMSRTDTGWQISALTLTVTWATGNQAIMGSPT